MVKQRFYFDTSVFGGMFDEEFNSITELLFQKVQKGEIICVYSDLIEGELIEAPLKVKKFFAEITKSNCEKVNVTGESIDLAQQYIDEKVVGKTSFDDCVHIATATLNKVDFLISWNFKHIVNVYRIRGYNAINLKNGLPNLEIRSPKDIVYEED